MNDLPALNGGNAGERIARAQELSSERMRNGELTVRLAQLEAQLATQKARNERSTTVRFIVMCVIVLIGLAAVVYLQVDSRGSGKLRQQLVSQCEARNANVRASQLSLQQQAVNNENAGQTQYAEVWRTLSDSLVTYDCGQLR